DPTDTTNPFTALNGAGFGVDFNPVPDRLRVVSDTNQNLRINPDNGRVITDTDINPGTPDLVASAYTNNFAGTIATTLYGIDAVSNSLVIKTPPNTAPPPPAAPTPGAGTAPPLNPGSDTATTGGPTPTNPPSPTLTTAGVRGLYPTALSAGTATLVGPIGP